MNLYSFHSSLVDYLAQGIYAKNWYFAWWSLEPIPIGKCNKKWWDSFSHLSLGLNSLPGSCGNCINWLVTLFSFFRAWLHGLTWILYELTGGPYVLKQIFKILRAAVPWSTQWILRIKKKIFAHVHTHWRKRYIKNIYTYYVYLSKN